MSVLRGITWNHTRGFTPLAACAQRFEELHPDVEVRWTRRSLLEFGETPVEKLVQDFDLLVIDHPFIGFAAAKGLFHPLDDLVREQELSDWMTNSVGVSTHSYRYKDRMWAAPIDAACPVAVWNPKALKRAGAQIPEDWTALISLAGRGRVLIPGVHTDAIHHFYMLCLAQDVEPGRLAEDSFVPPPVAAFALEELTRLYAAVPQMCWRMNPIQVHELLASGQTDAAYCPFVFGYSNYARFGYASELLAAGEPPRWNGRVLRTSLGGAGLAVSALCPTRETAAKFVTFSASGPVQRGLYWQTGGQPAHRAAWSDSENDRQSGGFLSRTLPALDRAWLRPRFPGYLHFQEHAAHAVHRAVCRLTTIGETVDKLEQLWRQALKIQGTYEKEI